MPYPYNLAVVMGLLLIVAFLTGWNAAVHKYRAQRVTLSNAVDQLEAELAEQKRKLAEDPIRAAIDIGKTNVLNQMESLLRQIRTAMT